MIIYLPGMIKNSLIVFFRKLRNNDIYSLINITGLGIGISACLLIFLYVADELSFDRHHEHAKNTYRLLLISPRTGKAMPILPAVIHPYIEDKVPGVEEISRVYRWSMFVFNAGNEPFTETGFMAADSSILNIFTFNFIQGNPETALSTPNSIIITPQTASKYFGDKDPIGQTIEFENRYTFVVSAVVEPFPSQSHIRFSMLAHIESMAVINPSMFDNWRNQSVFYYMKLIPGTNPVIVSERIKKLIQETNEDIYQTVDYQLQPLLDIRLKTHNIDWDNALTSDINIVRMFSAIAIVILALACFNFINLSIAMAIKRTREIGIKKVLGAGRRKLVIQFFIEILLVVFAALLIALLMVELALPGMNAILDKDLSLQLLTKPGHLVFTAILIFIVSLDAGAYQAYIITRVKAISAMKGIQPINSIRRSRIRFIQFRMKQLLMMFQFAISTALIIASLMIFKQMQYLSHRHPGYDKENLIAIKNPWDAQAPTRAIWLKHQMLQHSDVLNVSLAHNLPPVEPNNYTTFQYERIDGNQQLHAATISCDTDYFKTLKSRITAGRDFSDEMATDPENATIINNTMKARMGVDDPVGMTLNGFYDQHPRQIIGVVEDIHFTSMHELVGPMAFHISDELYPQNWFNILVRLREGSSSQVISYLEKLWQDDAPQWPLQYQFVEQQFLHHYQDDKRTMLIVTAFAGLAIILSLLGLIGLTLHATTTRTKEIGIRKVLGASTNIVIKMITNEFGILVIISNLLAWPISWYFLNRWLSNFAYSIHMNWMTLIIPALTVYLIACITVGIIAYRISSLNPVESLRNSD
jgi:putative ABC transport system permease protein